MCDNTVYKREICVKIFIPKTKFQSKKTKKQKRNKNTKKNDLNNFFSLTKISKTEKSTIQL